MRWADIKAAPLEYVITISPDGTVRLSKCWHWGNLPMGSLELAKAAVERDAGPHTFTIRQKRIRFGSSKGDQ